MIGDPDPVALDMFPQTGDQELHLFRGEGLEEWLSISTVAVVREITISKLVADTHM